MKCSEHPGMEMEVEEMAVGWGNENKLICPECKKEKRGKNNQVVFSSSSGWGR
jgi:hypothetical protein